LIKLGQAKMAASYTMRTVQVNRWRLRILPTSLFVSVLALAGCGEETAPAAPALPTEQSASAAIDLDEATLQLRDRGLAALHQEQPAEAEVLFRQLLQTRAEDPLAATNLAISLLRLERVEEASTLLAAQPAETAVARLLAVRAATAQAKGRPQAALADLQAALDASPEDAELRRFAIDLLDALAVEDPAAATDVVALRQAALTQWLVLRPDQPMARLLALQHAVQSGDRSAATGHYLRLRELLGSSDRTVSRILGSIGEGLNAGLLDPLPAEAADLRAHLRGATLLAQNTLPIERFEGEAAFNTQAQIELKFEPRLIDASAGVPGALAVADLDGDGRPDLYRIRAATADAPATLELRLGSAEYARADDHPIDARGVDGGARLLLRDISNDGLVDLLAFGAEGGAAFQGAWGGRLLRVPNDIGLDQTDAIAAQSFDADLDGDLDLILLRETAPQLSLHRNNLVDALQLQDAAVFGAGEAVQQARALVATDLDRDGRIDLLLAHADGLRVLLGRGRAEWAVAAELSGLPGIDAIATADLDDDGWVDLLLARAGGLEWLRNDAGTLAAAQSIELGADLGQIELIRVGDLDNDGREDLTLAGERGLRLARQRDDGGFALLPLAEGADAVSAVELVDIDGDGRLDLLASGGAGLTLWQNRSESRHDWLALRLRGLALPSRSNRFGIGSRIEVRRGDTLQVVEVQAGRTHLGLGSEGGPVQLTVHGPDGSIQRRQVDSGTVEIVEDRISDEGGPQLYAWDGTAWAHQGELLAIARPDEGAGSARHDLLRLRHLVERDGQFQLQLGAEYRHAVELAQVRLWVVDQPIDLELSGWPLPGSGATATPDLRGGKALQAFSTALDGRNIEVAERLHEVDGILADGYQPSAYPGIARGPWNLSLDFAQTPVAPVRLWLDGWMAPTGSVTDRALSQRSDFAHLPLRIEVEVDGEWQLLLADAGVPPVSQRTLAIDLPALPAGAQRIRMMSNRAMHWDRITWSTQTADAAHKLVAQRAPVQAELVQRGFARRYRVAPNAALSFDAAQLTTEAPWTLPAIESSPHGDVLASFVDEASEALIMAPGDGLSLRFDATDLPPVADGQIRSFWLESRGRVVVDP
jgi:hypothetical protein